MKKQLLFLFFFLNIPVLAVMCQTNKSGKKKIKLRHSVLQRATSCEVRISDLLALARRRRRSNRLPILDRSLRGHAGLIWRAGLLPSGIA